MVKLEEVVSTPSYKSDVTLNYPEHGFGLFQMQGMRHSQEDAAVARWYAKGSFDSLKPEEIGRRLWTTYKTLNQHCRHPGFGGATAATTVYDGKSHLITGTIGNIETFAVVYDAEGNRTQITRLNKATDHPEEDKARLEAAGAIIRSGRVIGINGSLATSRAMGYEEYRHAGVCDDAHIDITPLAGLVLPVGGKIQIITTSNGFTEPAPKQTKAGHEEWMMERLQVLPNIGNLLEPELAMFLSLEAFNHGAQENVSVSVQTLTQGKPFLTGVYDGHGGVHTSTYIAQNIGEAFEHQCSLSPEDYSKQLLSADRFFEIYYRDNKDRVFYEHLAAEKNARIAELSRPGGLESYLQQLSSKKEGLVDEVVRLEEKIGEPMRALLAIEDVRVFIEALCKKYVDLEIDKQDMMKCLGYVLREAPLPEHQLYQFLGMDLKTHKENACFLKNNRNLTQLLDDCVASLESSFTSGLTEQGLFKVNDDSPKYHPNGETDSYRP